MPAYAGMTNEQYRQSKPYHHRREHLVLHSSPGHQYIPVQGVRARAASQPHAEIIPNSNQDRENRPIRHNFVTSTAWLLCRCNASPCMILARVPILQFL